MADQRGIIRFGIFEINLAAAELRKKGTRIKLQEQPFQVLAALLQRPGEIVTKEELKEKIWSGDTFVDFDHSLATAVNKIREALGDSASSPRFIETVPRRGYRFIDEIANGPGVSHGVSVERGQAKIARRWWAMVAAAGLLALLGVILLRRPTEPAAAPDTMRAVPLTSLPGSELYPAFSPDGTRVAFAWNGEDSSNFDIYVQVVGTGAPVRLTEDPARDLDPSWSPDGRYLAFAREIAPGRVALMRISALGGQESVITEAADPPGFVVGTNHYARWSRSGDAILFADRQAKEEPFALYLYRLNSGERARLSYTSGFPGDVSPSLSADGAKLVFMRYLSASEGTIQVLELDSAGMPLGPSRQVLSLPSFIVHGPVLTTDSREIVFSMAWPASSLWRVELSGRSPARQLATIGERGISPSFSVDGKKLAYTRVYGEHDIWRLELSAPGIAAGQPRRWIYSTHGQIHADYSRDGAKIVFQSNRSGEHQIWVADADGSHAEQLTSLKAPLTGTPRWSPEGSKIAFDSNLSGRFDIYVMNANGGALTRLTQGDLQGHSARFSPDGKWIYFVEGLLQQGGLWRIPVGGGDAQKVAEGSLGRPFVSPDGRYVYHAKSGNRLWRVPAEGGKEEPVLESILSNASFAVVPEGIYYTPSTAPMAGADILFHRFADNSVTTVWRSPESAPDRFAISHDGRFLLFTLPKESGSDLMVVENFQ